MAASSAIALLAAAAGAVAAFSLSQVALEGWHRRSRALGSLAPSARGQGRLALVLQHGVGPLLPLARRMLAWAPVRKEAALMAQALEERGLRAPEAALVSCLVAATALVAAAAGVASGSWACALAAAACVPLVAGAAAHGAADRRALALREEVPEALRCMGVCFRSGLSLMQVLQQTGKDLGGMLGSLFSKAARRLEMGATPTEALSALDRGRQVPELSFVAVALDVQHQSGGSIAPVLEAAQESVESELDLLRSLKVQTAQAKLSARIVTIMPFVLVAIFSLMSEDFLAPFFRSATGMALLAVALAMELAGVLVVRRMLKVEG